MRIGVVMFEFPAWTETFVRRFLMALQDRGHAIRVFTLREPPGGPAIPVPKGLSKAHCTTETMREFGPDVLLGTLSFRALQDARRLGRLLGIPYVLQFWSGLDAFCHTTAAAGLFSQLGDDPLCRALVVEDLFMARWSVNRASAPAGKIVTVPNSLLLEQYERPEGVERTEDLILNVSRYVKKKGLDVLLQAVLGTKGRVKLIGDGPERGELEKLAGPQAEIGGSVGEADLTAWYWQAAVYAAPCIRVPDGDADGVPTTVLEAMACRCPILISDLLNAGGYVRHRQTGLLVPPGDVLAWRQALSELLDDAGLRQEMGGCAHAFAVEHLDVRKNVVSLEQALS